MFCTTCGTANPSPADRCTVCAEPFPSPPADLARPRTANPPPGTGWFGRRGGSGLQGERVDLPLRHERRGWPRPHGRVQAVYALTVVALLVASGAFGARYRSEQADRATWYGQAEQAAALGHPAAALAAYAAAGDYRDAEEQASALLAPYQEALRRGRAALDAGRYDEATEILVPVARDLPANEQARTWLEQARSSREADLLRRADAAVAERDWLGAERALETLLALAPDGATADRLTMIRREHAPITFTRDGALYLAGPNGEDERLLADPGLATWPVWSPDRTRIAFIVADPTDPSSLSGTLYVVGTDGRGLTKFAEQVLLRWWPAWSPDGTRIAYSSVEAFDSTRFEGTIGVRVLDTRTGIETDLTGDRFAYAGPPTWSPAGDRLAFVKREIDATEADEGRGVRFGDGDVLVMTLATGATTNLTSGRLPEVFRVAWSPRDEHLLVLAQQASAGVNADLSSAHLLDVITGDLTQVSDVGTDAGMPAWSPDGARFAYVENGIRVRVRTLQGEAMTLDAAGTLGGFLSWSPDGGALLAASADAVAPSTIIDLTQGTTARTFPLDHDMAQGSGVAAPPQWTPVILSPPAVPPTTSGTALDPAQELPRSSTASDGSGPTQEGGGLAR